MYAKHGDAFYGFRLITGVLLILLTGAQGRIIEAPENNFVVNGAKTEFTCCSDLREKAFFWKVKYIGSQPIKYIYDTGLVNGFGITGRFNVTVGSRSGCYSLIIKDVEMEDSGTYFCVDEEGLGEQRRWELVILESFECQESNRKAEYKGENNVGLPQDVISIECISKYFGNIPGKPICEWTSGRKMFDDHQHVTETKSTTKLNIQMPAKKEFNGDQISCHLNVDGESSYNQTPIVWNSSKFVINYASFHQKRVSQCSVEELTLDCHPPCSFKTKQFSNGSSYCEITHPGEVLQNFYVLLHDNNLHQTTFTSNPTNVNVVYQPQLSGIFVIAMSVLGTVLVCGAFTGAATLTYFIVKRRKRRGIRNTNPLEMGTFDQSHNGGRNTPPQSGIVISLGDRNNVTVNTAYGEQRNPVTMTQENKPLLEEVDTTELIRESQAAHSGSINVPIQGVAVLGEELFFAYRNCSRIKVYSSNTFTHKRDWELNELEILADVTACSQHKCLYISNIKVKAKECDILKVSPQGTLIMKWETGRNFGRLSVTHFFNVLMAVNFNRKLVEYNPDGTRLKEIQLANDIRPISALKINSNYYIVSHGGKKEPLQGVSQVDSDGNVLRRFGNTKGSANDQLDTPVHLIMNDDSIWVADSQNRRVVVLSTTLEYQSTLLSKKDGLILPVRICLDHVNRRFLLSDFQKQNHFLRVFDFK